MRYFFGVYFVVFVSICSNYILRYFLFSKKIIANIKHPYLDNSKTLMCSLLICIVSNNIINKKIQEKSTNSRISLVSQKIVALEFNHIVLVQPSGLKYCKEVVWWILLHHGSQSLPDVVANTF